MEYQLISWNIDSLNAALTSKSPRSILTRKVLKKIIHIHPEILALQEIKMSADPGKVKKLLRIVAEYFPDYKVVYCASQPPARKGYAGTMILYLQTLLQPHSSYPHIAAPETMDYEGRITTLEFPDFFVSTVYTPNSGQNLERLSFRQIWDDKYRAYLIGLNQLKPVLACGDFNVAHQENDLAHPANNHQTAGFTDEERQKFSQLLQAGFIDAFREIYPQAIGCYKDNRSLYTWFPQRVKTSKKNNSGWRIDYWIVSKNLTGNIKSCIPLTTGDRQDHLPLMLRIDLGSSN